MGFVYRETLVFTDKGYVSIRKLGSFNTEILVPNGSYKNPIAITHNAGQRYSGLTYLIHVRGLHRGLAGFVTTPDHLWPVSSGGVKRSKNLEVGMKLNQVARSSGGCTFIGLVPGLPGGIVMTSASITLVSTQVVDNVSLYGFKMAQNSHYIVNNGIITASDS